MGILNRSTLRLIVAMAAVAIAALPTAARQVAGTLAQHP